MASTLRLMKPLPALPHELLTHALWPSTSSNEGSSANALLQYPEVGAAYLNIMFTIRWIDRELLKNTPASGKEPIRRNLLGVDSSSKVAADKRLIQNLARELFDALEALDACSGEQAFEVDVRQLYEDESLMFLLASEASAQAVMDDATTAEAIEDEEDLPTMTMCQILLQAADFSALLRGGNPE